MNKIILLVCLLIGCAALRGQEKYTGIGIAPTITERIVHLPETVKPGLRSGTLVNYWDLPTDKVAKVLNPLDTAITTHIYCYSSFPSTFNFVVPAHTSQEMLFTTNATHMYETLCEIRSFEVINGTR